jgi:hypothetical protein
MYVCIRCYLYICIYIYKYIGSILPRDISLESSSSPLKSFSLDSRSTELPKLGTDLRNMSTDSSLSLSASITRVKLNHSPPPSKPRFQKGMITISAASLSATPRSGILIDTDDPKPKYSPKNLGTGVKVQSYNRHST